MTFWQDRAYVRCIERLKQSDRKALDELIRKIKRQDIHQKRLIHPRQNLPDANYLIGELKVGRVPEQQLHNFFSFWDKPSE